MEEHAKVGTKSTIDFNEENGENEGLKSGKTKTAGVVETTEDEKKTEKVTTDKDEKKKGAEEDVPNYGGIRRIGKEFGWNYLWMWCLAVLSSAGNGCTLPLFGTLFREMINSLVYAKNKQKAAIPVVEFFIVVGICALTLSVISASAWGYYGTKIGVDVRKKYFRLLLEQEIGYHDKKNSGRLNTKLLSETHAIDNAIGAKTGFAFQRVITFCVGIGLAFWYSWKMALVLIACVPAMIMVGTIQGLLWKGAGGQNADPFIDASSFSYEMMVNIRTVKAYPALLHNKVVEYGDILHKNYPASKKRALIIGAGLGLMLFSMLGVMYGIGLWYGSTLVEKNSIRVGDMFGCYFSFIIAGMALGEAGSVATDLTNGTSSANQFYHVLQRSIEVKQADIDDPIVKKQPLKGDIEFRGVTFSYPSSPDKTVINNLSFEIKCGQTFAIVGPSGSGKSTIVSLLERYYDPKFGQIYIDGELIHNYDIHFLRSQIGYVSQTPLLFDTTIEENVRAGNKNVTLEDVIDACKLADAHDFIIKFPDGYHTKVGSMGGRLSGGQKQRISIARALVHKPSILLLDEATSALDTKSERDVQKALDNISSHKRHTIVTIAHRLSTITHSDNICVLVEGEIDEMGSHDELMGLNGMYATLVKSQEIVSAKQEHSEL